MPTDSFEQISSFWRQYEKTAKRASAIQTSVSDALKKIASMNIALSQSNADVGDMDNRLGTLRSSILEMDAALVGNRSKMGPGEKNNPTVGDRLFVIQRVIEYSTYGPTETALERLQLVRKDLDKIENQLIENNKDLDALARRLEKAGGPWIEGTPIPKKN